jgi:hypothetical protein
MIVIPVTSTVRFTIDRALALSRSSIIDPSIRCKMAGIEGPLTIHRDVCCVVAAMIREFVYRTGSVRPSEVAGRDRQLSG